VPLVDPSVALHPAQLSRRTGNLGVGATDPARVWFCSLMTTMTTFDTILGRCGIAWTDIGISGVSLPSERLAATAAMDMPAFVADAIARITAMLAGASDDLAEIPIDDARIDDFRRKVYAATRRVPPGATTTYGEIARAIGAPPVTGARDVGVALARNPTPIIVPCHRVIAANGALTGFSAPGGLATKRRMLELEGAPGFGQQSLFG
jgi:methylated-DNA-[protein]-cysteine S-methyltransferase